MTTDPQPFDRRAIMLTAHDRYTWSVERIRADVARRNELARKSLSRFKPQPVSLADELLRFWADCLRGAWAAAKNIRARRAERAAEAMLTPTQRQIRALEQELNYENAAERGWNGDRVTMLERQISALRHGQPTQVAA